MVLRSKLAILTFVVLFVMCSNVEGRRCIHNFIRNCMYSIPHPVWRTQFGNVSISFGSRHATENAQSNTITPFPNQFDVYDINKDGQITLEELAKATNTKEHCALSCL